MNVNFVQQVKRYWKIMLTLVIILNLVFLLVFGISTWFSLPVENLLEDAASLYGFSQFSGFTTVISALILPCGIGAVLLLLLLNGGWVNKKREVISLIFMALISLFLFLDDLFLLHERVFTGMFQVGERTIFLAYLVCFSIFLFIFRQEVLTGPTLFLGIALLMFGFSISLDVLSDKVPLNDVVMESITILEEYAKLGGYLFWTALILVKARTIAQAGLEKERQSI